MDLALKCSGKCLIYIGTNKAILSTYYWLSMAYPELNNNIGIFTSMVSLEEKEEAKNKKIILSTTKSAGAAVDIYDLKMTVVIAEPFKSHVLTQQTIGRTRDSNTYYIDCVDIGFRQLLRYYNYKKPVIDKYCTSREQIILNRDELAVRSDKIVNARGPVQLVQWNDNATQLVEWAKE
jgi:hypothetical protein